MLPGYILLLLEQDGGIPGNIELCQIIDTEGRWSMLAHIDGEEERELPGDLAISPH